MSSTAYFTRKVNELMPSDLDYYLFYLFIIFLTMKTLRIQILRLRILIFPNWSFLMCHVIPEFFLNVINSVTSRLESSF